MLLALSGIFFFGTVATHIHPAAGDVKVEVHGSLRAKHDITS